MGKKEKKSAIMTYNLMIQRTAIKMEINQFPFFVFVFLEKSHLFGRVVCTEESCLLYCSSNNAMRQ